MKKIFPIIQSLSISIAAISFATAPVTVNADSLAEFPYEEEAQYMFMQTANEQPIARCEEGYYIRIEDILFFADSELQSAIPLCYRPECLHAKAETKTERAECSAYLGDQDYGPSVSYADGHLYITSPFDLINKDVYRDKAQRLFLLSADGVEKKLISEFPAGIETAVVVHRGYYYYSRGENTAEEDGKVKTLRIIARMPVDGGEEEVIYTSDDVYVVSVIPYKEYVYFTYTEDGEDVNYVYLTETKELKKIPKPAENTLFYERHIEGDHLLWRGARAVDMEEDGWETIWRSDLDGSNMEVAFSLEDLENWDGEEKVFGTDGRWIYQDDFPISFETEKDRQLLYYDRETLQYSGSINLGQNMGWTFPLWGDDRYLFFFNYPDYPDKDKTQVCYVRKADMETGNAEFHVLAEGNAYSHGWVSYN